MNLHNYTHASAPSDLASFRKHSIHCRLLTWISLVFVAQFIGCDFVSESAPKEPVLPITRENPHTPDYLKPENEVPPVDDVEGSTPDPFADKSQTDSSKDFGAEVNPSEASPSSNVAGNSEKKLPEASSLPSDSPSGARPSNSATILKYKFESGRFETYPYELIPKNQGSKRIRGAATFVAYSIKDPKIDRPTIEASGTGWVVSPDGYLLTCAHVVDEANRIDVIINEKKYSGSIVAQDPTLDLALIKIDAENLIPLNLVSGDGVEQGQDVRSVGFPLSSVLGESIKINRGTVAGFVTIEGRSLVQIDVPINPGNSGGPIVDLSGNVVGVASDKLAGAEISSVGFCVPAKVVQDWLKLHLKTVPTSLSNQELSGVELSRKVFPGVALVKVTAGGINPNAKVFEISTTGRFEFEGTIDFSLNSHLRRFESAKLLMDDSGEVLQAENNQQLPLLLGDTTSLQLPELSRTGATKWKNTSNFQLSVAEENETSDPLDALLLGPTPFGLGGRARERVVTIVPGVRVDDYKIIEVNEKSFIIEKTWDISTSAPAGSTFQLSNRGKGTWTFDRELGLMTDFSGEGTFIAKDGTKEDEVPFSITMKRDTVDLNKIAEEEKKKKALAAAESSKSTSNKSIESRSPAEQKSYALKELVAKLSPASSPEKALASLKELTQMEVDSEQSLSVLKTLVSMLKHTDAEVRSQAIQALGHWDNATHLPRVVPLLQDSDEKVVTSAINYIGDSWDGRAAKDLAKIVNEKPQFRPRAFNALTEIGPAAESAVLELLDADDLDVCKSACQSLGKIGGPASIVKLKKLIASSHPAREEAKAALKEIGIEE